MQLTTDGFRPYLQAVEDAFGADIDYAMLIKLYGSDPEAGRFSPPVIIAEDMRRITGDPDPSYVSTSYVERQNLTMRMGMRRFTRLTNAFSKKVVNHEAAVALHYMHYNFARPHTSLRDPYPRTPAMAAGVADHIWTCEEIAALWTRIMATMDPSVAACPICQHGRPRDVIATSAATWVTAAREAALPGYVCVVSKVHVIEPYQLRGLARRAFWDDVSTVAEAVQRATASPKLNYEVHGNTIPHLHMHIFPRFAGDPFEGRAIDPRSGPTFFRSDADLAALKDALAAAGVRRSN